MWRASSSLMLTLRTTRAVVEGRREDELKRRQIKLAFVLDSWWVLKHWIKPSGVRHSAVYVLEDALIGCWHADAFRVLPWQRVTSIALLDSSDGQVRSLFWSLYFVNYISHWCSWTWMQTYKWADLPSFENHQIVVRSGSQRLRCSPITLHGIDTVLQAVGHRKNSLHLLQLIPLRLVFQVILSLDRDHFAFTIQADTRENGSTCGQLFAELWSLYVNHRTLDMTRIGVGGGHTWEFDDKITHWIWRIFM